MGLCTSCPGGTTLSSGSCIASAAATACSASSPNCLVCDMTGVLVTACYTCTPGYYIMGAGCTACPTSCGTCLAVNNCQTCQPSYILLAGRCICNEVDNFFETGSSCKQCSTIFTNCQTCSYNGVSTNCMECVQGYYVSSNVCEACNATCLTCTTVNTCTSCP